MANLPHDHIIPFQSSDKNKKAQVAEMFDEIAPRYDLMNRVLSARIDVGWRKKALRDLKKYAPQKILDIATGTGDLAIMACKILNPEHITGVDISQKMLDVGVDKVAKEHLDKKITLELGDSENLHFEDNTFDAVMAAFGVRNFENLELGLAEMKRVLKDKGRLCIIEFSQPNAKVFGGLYKFYMQLVAPKIAKAFHQNKEAYKYLNESAKAFPERDNFTTILKSTGFRSVDFKVLTFGICCVYTAEK